MPKNLELSMNNSRFLIPLALAASSVLAVSFLGYRIFYTQSLYFLFLIWNLFLAWIPFVASYVVFYHHQNFKRKISLFFLIFVWFIFFPNTFYIFTDLFHLRPREMPFWFDLGLLLAFSWSGSMLGFVSLIYLQNLVKKIKGNFYAWTFSLASLLLCSFGIYIGRYLRWNSWDVLTNPFNLFYDIIIRIISPFQYPRTIGMTLMFFFLLSSWYLFIRILINANLNPRKKQKIERIKK